MKREKISELTTNRLSVYLRCLNHLAAAGIKTVSSQELAEQFNLNSAQIRKDLGYFGEFGVRGVGYFTDDLRANLTKILGLDKPHRVGIVGAGRLGTALANYNGLSKSNFAVVALFDNDSEKIGQVVGPDRIPILHGKKIAKVVHEEGIDVCVIAVPARVAQRVLKRLQARRAERLGPQPTEDLGQEVEFALRALAEFRDVADPSREPPVEHQDRQDDEDVHFLGAFFGIGIPGGAATAPGGGAGWAALAVGAVAAGVPLATTAVPAPM
jgi:redox-sensing transcriptional repressor